jgi:hypothetical protein
MRNKFSLLGLLGLLGILGLDWFTGNTSLFGFFGFFGFFGLARVKPDELFHQNQQKSALYAFYIGMLSYGVFLVLAANLEFQSTLVYGFMITFALQIAVFVVTLFVNEKATK